jgi:hypothetical protein
LEKYKRLYYPIASVFSAESLAGAGQEKVVIIHLYTVSLNEMPMLGFFFRHYEPFVKRFVFFDDNSTDGTLSLLQSKSNVEVRRREYPFPDSLVRSGKEIRDKCWKESRGAADWVIIADVDEHLYHPHIEQYLSESKRSGVTLIPALGYEMFTDEFPAADEYLAETRTFGAATGYFNKLSIFDPDAIDEVDFSLGAHLARPRGNTVLPSRDELLLLHYKYLGLHYAFERNRFLDSGRRELDRKMGWGFHYGRSFEEYLRQRSQISQSLVNLRDPQYVPWRDSAATRWWRP